MGMIIYGTKVFAKSMGYVGSREECPVCTKAYKKSIVRFRRWFHIDEVPLFPVKSTYVKICPICAQGEELAGKAAKAELAAMPSTETQNLNFYAKHILANKPKGIMSVDQSYEFWAKDLETGEDICIGTGLTKDNIKGMRKDRGIKKVEFINVE